MKYQHDVTCNLTTRFACRSSMSHAQNDHNLCANDKQIRGWAETVHVPLILHTSPNDEIKWYSIHRCFGSRWCVPAMSPYMRSLDWLNSKNSSSIFTVGTLESSSCYDSVKVLPRKFVGASKSWSDWPFSEEAPPSIWFEVETCVVSWLRKCLDCSWIVLYYWSTTTI